MLVYHVSSSHNFNEIKEDLKVIRQLSSNCLITLVGVTCDLSHSLIDKNKDSIRKTRKVSYEQGLKFAMKHGLSFMEVRTRFSSKIMKAHESMIRDVIVHSTKFSK